MSLITIDFETYYTSKDLGFRTQTTEEYIRDSRFEVIGVAVQVDAGEPVWFSGDREATRKWLKQFDWLATCRSQKVRRAARKSLLIKA